jgi:hypothetical protein
MVKGFGDRQRRGLRAVPGLPPVQSLPIGNTCPEDIQRRLTSHLSDLLRHPEQMSRVVDGTGHIREMRRVRLQEEPIPWDGSEPPPLSVAKPLHQWLHIFGDSLELMVVFKCLEV